MRVHHLNCGTMRLARTRLVTHVLLVETGRELILVDSGIGLADIADPRGRIGPYRHIARPALDPGGTAVRRIERLGLDPADVAHIVVTHLDFDHIGGAADFPRARIHVTAGERAAADTRRTLLERSRYHPAGPGPEPRVTTYEPTGDTWRGFAAVRPLDGIGADIALIPLPGHTRGHAAVAVDTGVGLILHAGDAFYHHNVLSGRRQPTLLGLQERLVAHDWKRVRANHEALAELHGRGDPGLLIVNAHDAVLLDRATDPDHRREST
ncbi:MBL fold metallo-hydrolase [Phytomonospora endophytica]|uniref:Glyoxylase-like metal-dependent hydrolase (Beta-lactamase superfamily II) n=1 Tax=Phytomonospora endophytica TaxID=714109 RepID=A0A841FW44_9ACTN|nr:MBL fold metallo-hydrolase [Phytomonospora endophytica]MBB6036200.1 glyoxylase-like metal-dependent hydrolase (beta-lactamase superfamily II) [Phytomonospora endophytica]GIG67106.1 putative metallo-hydrolase [Phytomonospora endophytica]